MATRAKKRGTPTPKKDTKPLLDLMKSVDATAKEKGTRMFDLEGFESTYGVKYFISTGLPSFDLMLMSNKARNLSGSHPYGFPTGRVVEICGDEQSFKTWITHSISARVRSMGGLVFLIQSENDFDLSFYKSFYDRYRLDFKKEVTPFVRASSANTIGDVVQSLRTILPNIREHYENGGSDVPTVIVLDSLAAMFSTEDHERYEKDEVAKMGSHDVIRVDFHYNLNNITKN